MKQQISGEERAAEPAARIRLAARSRLLEYAVAPVSVALATVAREYLGPAIGDRFPFIMYFFAIVCSAGYGGLGPAVLATLLGGIVAALFYPDPMRPFTVSDRVDQSGMIVYACVGIAIAFIGEAQRQSRIKLESGARRMEESERLLSTTLRSIGDAVITTDAAGRVTFINATAESLTGWEADAAAGQPCAEVFRIIDEETRQKLESPVRTCLEQGAVVELTNHAMLLARDGSEHPIDNNGAPIKDESGDILGSVLVFRDISGRKQIESERSTLLAQERAARENAERATAHLSFLAEASRILSTSLNYQTSLDQVARLAVPALADWCDVQVMDGPERTRRVAIAHTDPDKVALAYELDKKYPMAPVQAKALVTVLNAGKPKLYTEVPDSILQAQARDDEHLRILRELGVKSAIVAPLMARGAPLGVIRLVYAESDRRYSEQDLPLVEDLARRAGAAIDNARLFSEARTALRASEEAVGELAAADHLKNQFLAMLAHELRNPLGAISNAVQVMDLAGCDSALAQRSREVVGRQTRHMSRLVDELLDVSRIARGKINLQLERMDLCPLVKGTCEDYRRILEAAGLTFDVRIPDEPLWVDADATRIRQVLANLLQNAAKFTDPGGSVAVEASIREADRLVEVTIRDTGIGIPPNLLARLFEAFVQAEQSLDRTQGGLGLGLALARGIIELHGGQIRAESSGAGKGACFTFDIPARPPGSVSAPPSDAPANQGALRVLVIEDNPDAAETMRDMMDLFGHVTAIAHTGPAGVDSAREFKPDVVLCDLGLPGMDGYAVAKMLRSDAATRDCRLIAVSGYGTEEDRKRCSESGFDLHLIKPVDPQALKEILLHPASSISHH